MAEAKITTKKKTAVKKVTEKVVKELKVKAIKGEKDGIIKESTDVKTQTNKQSAEEVVKVEPDAPEKVTKAGKHSPKAIKEAEELEAKEVRKASAETVKTDEKPKKIQKPARSKLERRSKAYRKAQESIDKTKTYELKEALESAIKSSTVKFDATVELHVNLDVDPRQADQNIRGTVVLPAGTGKSARVAVFADEEDAKKAKAAGADIAAGDDFLKQLDKGMLDFDVLISTPTYMAKLGKFARVLGPKGLMPNPKSGTVTTDIVKAVKEAKAGRVEYRVDSTGIVHVGVGKVSFGVDKLVDNSQAIINGIKAAKPASLKGIYVKSAYITTSMGPSIKTTI